MGVLGADRRQGGGTCACALLVCAARSLALGASTPAPASPRAMGREVKEFVIPEFAKRMSGTQNK